MAIHHFPHPPTSHTHPPTHTDTLLTKQLSASLVRTSGKLGRVLKQLYFSRARTRGWGFSIRRLDPSRPENMAEVSNKSPYTGERGEREREERERGEREREREERERGEREREGGERERREREREGGERERRDKARDHKALCTPLSVVSSNHGETGGGCNCH